MASRALKSAPIPATEDQAIRDFLSKIQPQCVTLIGDHGIKVLGAAIRKWQSQEDPEWRLHILDLVVDAPAEQAIKVWDDLGGLLLAAIEAERPGLRDLLGERTSISVDWREE